MKQRRVAAGNGPSTGLSTTIKYVRRAASGAAENGRGTTAMQVPESAPSVEQQAIKLKAGKFGCLGSCCARRKLAPASRSEAGRVFLLSKGKQEKKVPCDV
jgi:hypothetical protein